MVWNFWYRFVGTNLHFWKTDKSQHSVILQLLLGGPNGNLTICLNCLPFMTDYKQTIFSRWLFSFYINTLFRIFCTKNIKHTPQAISIKDIVGLDLFDLSEALNFNFKTEQLTVFVSSRTFTIV